MKRRGPRVVGVSDVSVGYGSPQIPAFIASVATHYGGEGIVLEPDQIERAPRDGLFPAVDIERLATSFHPYSAIGRLEYNVAASRRVDALAPDVLVVFGEYCLPVLAKLRRRPRVVILYALELITYPFDIEVSRAVCASVDLMVFPEENRARLHADRCGHNQVPRVIVYNCAPHELERRAVAPAPAAQRNGRIVYHGTIEHGRTYAEYFLDAKTQALPLDTYGVFGGPRAAETRAAFRDMTRNSRFLGYVDAARLAEIRRDYLFSIVMWNPDQENQYYAAPNKFFESIVSGVPPIAAPHPQCRMLLERYDCGLAMSDWSFGSFLSSLRRGLALAGSERYAELVRNCGQAVRAELNWATQFAKVATWLPSLDGAPATVEAAAPAGGRR
ncbi:MAG: glycosyltransferase [Armatimonadetes bacterium]|nr:glycosyltransferase [Armatimonadota bacterium]